MPSYTKLSRVAKHLSTAFTVLALLAAYSGHDGPVAQITRVMSSLATVGESASRASAQILDRSADIVAGASSAVMAVSTTTMDAAAAAWSGIDLMDMKMDNFFGRVMAENGDIIAKWTDASFGRSTTKCDIAPVIVFWQGMARTVSFQMPAAEASLEHTEVHGLYWKATGRAFIAFSGHISLEFTFNTATFQPRWANPVWELMEVNISSEAQQITDIIRAYTNRVQGHNVSWGPLPFDVIGDMTLNEQLTVRLCRWGRTIRIVANLLGAEICSLRVIGLLLALLAVDSSQSFRNVKSLIELLRTLGLHFRAAFDGYTVITDGGRV